MPCADKFPQAALKIILEVQSLILARKRSNFNVTRSSIQSTRQGIPVFENTCLDIKQTLSFKYQVRFKSKISLKTTTLWKRGRFEFIDCASKTKTPTIKVGIAERNIGRCGPDFTTMFLKDCEGGVMHLHKLWENKKQKSESVNLQFYSATLI